MSEDLQKDLIAKMTKEAKRVARRIGAESCIVIGIFREDSSLRFMDVGGFPMPPQQFYQMMKQAHHEMNDNVPAVRH